MNLPLKKLEKLAYVSLLANRICKNTFYIVCRTSIYGLKESNSYIPIYSLKGKVNPITILVMLKYL